QELVDRAVGRVEPRPRDASPDEGHDLGKEEDRLRGARASRVKSPDQRRGDEPERDRQERVEEDELEGIEQCRDTTRVAEDLSVVREPHPPCLADAVPAVERVLHRAGEGLQREEREHRERGEDEDPCGPRAAPLSVAALGAAAAAGGRASALRAGDSLDGDSHRPSSVSYACWTCAAKSSGVMRPVMRSCRSGPSVEVRMPAVALPRKSIAPSLFATAAAPASVSLMTEPSGATGGARSAGPPGVEPVYSSTI